jgi:DNA polymerase-3 subunit delta'
MYYPWHASLWQKLIAQCASLPHALLLTGEAGIGKYAFALYLSQYLLCESIEKQEAPCEQCAACRWFIEGNHPDFQMLSIAALEEQEEPEARKHSTQWITVDAIRALGNFVYTGAHRRGRRVIMVYPAEALNLAAANALLKMLEEPPADVLFILVSHHWQRLLPTIKSRCRRFALSLPHPDVALDWLATQNIPNARTQLFHVGGAPLRAIAAQTASIQLDELLYGLAHPREFEVAKLAATLEKQKASAVEVIECLQKWVMDCILYAQTGNIHYYPDFETAIAQYQHITAWDFYDVLINARKQAQHPLNQRLFFEKLFYGWMDVLRQSAI